jgi:SAM-dependent methyltransferase
MRAEVCKHHAQAAPQSGMEAGSCCGGGCRGGAAKVSQRERGGYDGNQLASIPVETDLGLGCGNPTAPGGLHPGETVADFGPGGGIDCFLARRKVGPGGKVVDMTPEMLDRGRDVSAEGRL